MGKKNIGRMKSKKRPQVMSRRQRIAGKKKQRVSVKKRKSMSVKLKRGGQKKQKWEQAGIIKSISPIDFFEDTTKPLGFAQKFAKREQQKLF